jgi:hypothetical protein
MKPDSRIDGRKTKKDHLHRLELVLRDGGEGDAHGQIRGDEDERDDEQSGNAAVHRHVKSSRAAMRMTATWM